MVSHSTDATLALKDGRTLGYAEYGDPSGRPVFYFHGSPGSRLEGQLIDAAARRHGARVIALDRPGFGLSDFKPGRSLADWPEDVGEAADALGVERFAVLGLSAGGPHVAACAVRIPRRLTAVAIVSGVGPFEAPGATDGMSAEIRLLFALLRRFEPSVRIVMWLLAHAARRFPRHLISMQGRSACPSDRAILARPEVRAIALRDAGEPFRRGSRGAAWELVLLSRPWGFRLEDIDIEVHMWQGEADVMVPPSMGRYLASAIPNCRATFCPGEGHLMIVDHADEIFGALVRSGVHVCTGGQAEEK